MKNAFIICVFSFSSFFGYSQSIQPSVINSGGNFYHSGKYGFEWSIGEMPIVESMKESNSFWLTNGLLQPHTSGQGIISRNPNFLEGTIIVAPVPATTHIEINYFIREKGTLLLRITDVLGKTVYLKERWHMGLDMIERIPLYQFAKGQYILTIEMPGNFGNAPKKGTYEIIKI